MIWFCSYYVLSGLIVLLWFLYELDFKEEESEDIVADLTWNTGFKRGHIKLFLYLLAILLGWFILPYEIINMILGIKE